MFEALSKGFRNARNRLAGVTELTEENLDQALRDVRLSLLEADVELGVTKRFLARVKEKTVGEVVRTRATVKGKKLKVGPAEQFIKICQDELIALMAYDGSPLSFEPGPAITGIMMVGLQGAGKTTTSAKVARYCEQQGRRPLLVAADLQRPGAIEQLQVLGERLNIPVYADPGATPFEVCRKALAEARKLKCDTVVYDTAGRLAIDEPLMQELLEIKTRVRPQHVLLVIDAMIGQDSVKTAAAFHERLTIGGVVLTKLDGDARGGAALSVREVTGAPIKFTGTGEALDRLEEFRPDGMASRILGFGDVVGLMKDFESVVDEEKAQQDAERMLSGRFTFDDFLEQIGMLQQMGPLQDVMEKLPFFADSMPEGFQVDEAGLHRIRAIVNSMTKQERREPHWFERQPARVARVAKGSGRPDKEVTELLQRFAFMRNMMEQIGSQAGLLRKIPGMKQLAMANQLRKSVRMGGFEGNPMLSNLTDSLLEAAVAEGGSGDVMQQLLGGRGAGTPKRKPVSPAKRKQQRKQQRQARRKSRK